MNSLLGDRSVWHDAWDLRPGVTYLNHGSFGPPPRIVQAEQRRWRDELDRQPMDFFCRMYEPAWFAARAALAEFIGASEDNLIFTDNATHAMNIVADSFPLAAGDEVVLNDHEYGAVLRIWKRALARAGGGEPRIAKLPQPIESPEQVVESIFREVTPQTRLIVASHITSPTAITLPVEQLCSEARRRGIAVCIDGPHAIAQLDLRLEQLGCDFYTASCHKWLSAPFGSGFLYVAPRHQPRIQPPLLSWGRLLPRKPDTWFDEFIWSGTRDPSAYFAVPAAIEFLRTVGLETFRRSTHGLARYARERLVERFRLPPLVPDSPAWYGSMAHVPLPDGVPDDLQERLWQRHSIEIPVVRWSDRRWLRVSCHLYNDRGEIDRLLQALDAELKSG